MMGKNCLFFSRKDEWKLKKKKIKKDKASLYKKNSFLFYQDISMNELHCIVYSSRSSSSNSKPLRTAQLNHR